MSFSNESCYDVFGVNLRYGEKEMPLKLTTWKTEKEMEG
jgi:hypothetical protein